MSVSKEKELFEEEMTEVERTDWSEKRNTIWFK